MRDNLSLLMGDIREMKQTGELDDLAKSWGRSFGNMASGLVSAIKAAWEFRYSIAAGVAALATYKTITSVIVSLEAFKRAQEAATVAQAAFNAVSKVNPYVLLASALAAVTVAVVAFVQSSNDAAERIKRVSDKSDEAAERVAELGGELDRIESGGVSEVSEELTSLDNIAENILPKIEELGEKTNRTAGENQLLQEYINIVNAALGDEVLSLNAATGALVGNTNEIYRNIEALKAQVIQKATMDRIIELQKEKIRLETEDIPISAQAQYEALNALIEQDAKFIQLPMPSYTAEKNYSDALEAHEQNLETCAKIDRLLQEYEGRIVDTAQDSLEQNVQTQNTYVKASDDYYKQLKTQREADLISQSEYQREVQKFAGDALAEVNRLKAIENRTADEEKALTEALSTYKTYYSELEKAQKSSSGKLAKTTKEATEEANDTYFTSLKNRYDAALISTEEYYAELQRLASDELDKIKQLEANSQRTKKEQEALEKSLANYKSYYSELEKICNKSAKSEETALKNWVKTQEKAYSDFFNARKKAAEKDHKAKVQEIDDELTQEERRINGLIAAIDAEIKARERLKASKNAQAEIDEVASRLQYDQLDEFTRQELERRLARLQGEKADTDWKNQQEDKKESLRSELVYIKEEAAARKAALAEEKEAREEMFENEKQKVSEIFDIISTNFQSLASFEKAGITSIGDVFAVAVNTEKQQIDATFTMIKNGTVEVADLYSNKITQEIGKVFDYQISRAKDAISQLWDAIERSKSAARSARSSNSSTTYNNTRADIKITNSALSAGQIAQRVRSGLYDPIM